jgi:hypothetical protein
MMLNFDPTANRQLEFGYCATTHKFVFLYTNIKENLSSWVRKAKMAEDSVTKVNSIRNA